VAADWHELMIPQRPSIARVSEQLDPQCSTQTYHCYVLNLVLRLLGHGSL